MALLRSTAWFALFLASTFVFTVLFEHGPANFANNARQELDTIKRLYGEKEERKKNETDKVGR